MYAIITAPADRWEETLAELKRNTESGYGRDLYSKVGTRLIFPFFDIYMLEDDNPLIKMYPELPVFFDPQYENTIVSLFKIE